MISQIVLWYENSFRIDCTCSCYILKRCFPCILVSQETIKHGMAELYVATAKFTKHNIIWKVLSMNACVQQL